MSLFWDASREMTQWNESLCCSLSNKINYPVVVWELAGSSFITFIHVKQIRWTVSSVTQPVTLLFWCKISHRHWQAVITSLNITVLSTEEEMTDDLCPVHPCRATKSTTSASGRGSSRTRRPSRCPDGSCLEACVSRSPTTATRPPSTRRWLESHTVSTQAFLLRHRLFVLHFTISRPKSFISRRS